MAKPTTPREPSVNVDRDGRHHLVLRYGETAVRIPDWAATYWAEGINAVLTPDEFSYTVDDVARLRALPDTEFAAWARRGARA